eukprot:1161683-Pelagomonas_calceolata.AAC.4
MAFRFHMTGRVESAFQLGAPGAKAGEGESGRSGAWPTTLQDKWLHRPLPMKGNTMHFPEGVAAFLINMQQQALLSGVLKNPGAGLEGIEDH